MLSNSLIHSNRKMLYNVYFLWAYGKIMKAKGVFFVMPKALFIVASEAKILNFSNINAFIA